jgi:hypothetical protein
MVIFNSYVSLPEGMGISDDNGRSLGYEWDMNIDAMGF